MPGFCGRALDFCTNQLRGRHSKHNKSICEERVGGVRWESVGHKLRFELVAPVIRRRRESFRLCLRAHAGKPINRRTPPCQTPARSRCRPGFVRGGGGRRRRRQHDQLKKPNWANELTSLVENRQEINKCCPHSERWCRMATRTKESGQKIEWRRCGGQRQSRSGTTPIEMQPLIWPRSDLKRRHGRAWTMRSQERGAGDNLC